MSDFQKKLRNLITELDFIEGEKDLYAFEDKLKKLYCRQYKHKYVFDHCGYWQHQYCSICGEPKYRKFIRMKCSELDREFGNITEQEWENANPPSNPSNPDNEDCQE